MMAISDWIGSKKVRASLLFLGGCLFGLGRSDDAMVSLVGTVGRNALWGVFGLLCFMAAIFSSRRLFVAWMAFAEKLQVVVVTAVFGLAYVLVVPVFFILSWAKDPLKLRGSSTSEETFWVPRDQPPLDQTFFERLG